MERTMEKIIPDTDDPCFLPKYTLNITTEERVNKCKIINEQLKQLKEQHGSLSDSVMNIVIDGNCIGRVSPNDVSENDDWAPYPYYSACVYYPIFDFTDHDNHGYEDELCEPWYNILKDVHKLASEKFNENIISLPDFDYGYAGVIHLCHQYIHDMTEFTPLEMVINEVKFIYFLIKFYEKEILEMIHV